MQIDSTQLNYWQEQLKNAPVMLTLPIDKQRLADTTPQTAVHHTTLPADSVQNETYLLAAYILLLHRHSQQDDIVVGTAVANHLLPLRAKITPDTTFAQLVEQLAQAQQQAQNNALPLPALINELQPAQDGSYAPLFQAVFAAGNLPETAYNALYDLTLVVKQEENSWRCCWHYRADLFTEPHIQQFATHLATLLRAAADNPDCSVTDLEMMPLAERELLLHTWNQTTLDVPHDLCLHEWIAQQAAKTPERTAVSDTNHTSLTYAELDYQSGQLAAHLRQQGVKPGVVVAFTQERTVRVLVTLLGILKAGGTYLPLTAESPAERIKFMLEDACTALLLTESHLVQNLPVYDHLPLIKLDSQWTEIASREPLTDYHYPPETTAYIIYTSGSTGVPKGVPISHNNIVNLTASMLQEPGMTADDKFLAITALSFDILGYELYSPLVVGGEVVIASEKMIRDGHLLSDRLAEGDITFLQGTPVTWQMLLAAGWSGTPSLKMISCGEALTRHLATQLLARGQALWNLYGPTEATIFATGHRVLPEELDQLNRDDLPIGRPVHNMQAYILDANQRLLPIGAVGELYLGGAGLSQGYLNRPNLTAERFIPLSVNGNPLSVNRPPITEYRIPNTVYRTGDLARYRHDGVIEYLGRTDYQVKLHGFRIELGEIESRLEELPEVQTAVAIVWTNPANNDRQLVAYFVSASGETVDTEQIRAALKSTLPSYMVPGILMQLPQLPATPNGKVDRKALPTPQETRERERPYAAPRNSVEEQLAELWAKLFSVERVGIQDSFLDMGGHSLLATQLVSDIQSALGVRLSVGDLFRHETIAELAAVVVASQQDATAAPAIIAVDEKKHTLSAAQRRLWFFYKLDPQSPAYNEPIAIRLRGPVNVDWLQQSLTDMVARHEVLRTVYFEEEDVYGRVQPIDQLPVPVLDLRHLPKREQETAITNQIAREDQRPFNLTNDIPIRIKLLHLDEDHWVLLLVLHHIAMDLWSIELIIEEITILYRAYQAGQTPQLPELPIQYSDYAAWQEKWLAEHEAEQLAYWKKTLAPDPEPLQLLTAKPRSDKPNDEGANFSFHLPDVVMQQTSEFMQKERVTLFMLLLATYQALMHRYTQQDEINVGVPFANRHQNHTEKLIGFFTNTVVMNASFTPGMTFRQLLGQVWERVLGGQDNQDLPFNKVVEAVQTTRRENMPPLFQTFFTVQAVEGRPQIPGIEIEPVSFETNTAKFDLMLSMAKQGQQINGFVEYRTALFTPERIELFSRHYVNILAELMQQPDRPIVEIDFRTEAEKEQQATAQQTAVPPQTLIEKFTEIAERFGTKTAVSSSASSLTYQQLHQQSNQIAHLLLAHDIQANDVVAIYAATTPQIVTAVLGVLKVGAVYLPLNEDDPAAWHQAALQEGQAKLLLHSEANPVNDINGYPKLAIETAQSTASDNLPAPAAGGILLQTFGCYSVTDLLHLSEIYPVQMGNQVLQFAPFASHPATHEMFATLINGGTLHLAPRDQLTKLSSIYDLLKNQQIDFAILPAVLIAALDPKRLPQLQTIVSLEADMEQSHWQKWTGRQRLHGHLNGVSILPAVLSKIETAETWLSGTAVPPITLRNAQAQPTPAGVLGTLHITEQSTGDNWCWLPDGRLQFRHYHPTHTTTRGRYVQTEAIAAVLQQHPAVEKCIVLPDQNPCEKRLLTAYIVPTGAFDADQFNQFAQAQLPSQLIPAHYQTVPRIPLTPAGQVDYQALQTMQQEETQQDQQADARAAKRSALAERRKNLSAKQQALLNKWQKKKTDDSSSGRQAIPKQEAGKRLPLSFAQRRLLVLDHLDPNKATYNVPMAFQVDGRLDEAALQKALDTLYTRHSSLRTTFFYGDDEQPYQHIADAAHLPINRVDFSEVPEAEREDEARQWVQAEVQRPFNLSTGPLIRVSHLRLSEAQHVLVIVMHHIITDGWSMNIFVREFLQLYSTLVQNLPDNLPDLLIDYGDFAAWQQKWLQGEVLEQQLVYWKDHLTGAPAVLNLPTDLPRPKMQSTHGRTFNRLLPAELTPALAELSQANSSTLFMTLFAAYNLLLARYSQQDDLVVGTPIANRNQPGIENLIGFFVNMLPLRTQIGEEETFTTLLSKVRQAALEGYNHQNIPFEQVVNSLQPDRDTSYSPVFQVTFALRNNENMELPSLDGLRLTPLPADSNTAKYDLTLVVIETNNGLLCSWEYCTDLFLADTIERMHTHFEMLLHSIVNDPTRHVKKLNILPEAEKQLLLHEWQGKVDDTIPQICLHEQFELWVEKQPEVTAVSDPHLTLTYKELNQRANQLARLLINQGVRPGDTVGIHMTASTPAIVIIMACHKARAAYVPFDPTYPTQRLQLMLDDTAAPVVLTDSSLDHLDTGSCTVWHWQDIQPRLAEQEATNLDLDYTPADPAYIIYTSGSTGKPKGVVCGHTGVFNLQRSFDQWGALPPQAIFSLWTSLNFDASVYEIFPAFITGGSLHIVPQEIRSDAPALFTWLAKNRIQHSYLPPFMVEPFYKWLQEGENSCAMLRLMVGVEPLVEQTLVGIQDLVPGLTVLNAYGPTEATVVSTIYRVPPDSTRPGNAPIGQAMLNYQVYLLDEFMQPVPIGVAGELYVGGIGLAHGYLNRPELTNEKFVENPFDKVTRRQGDKVTDHPLTLSPAFAERRHLVTPSRLYRTGDLARYLPDGNIMFIGRTDFQLKVRGFRVELGEIEANLLAQAGVETAVVMPHTAADGQTTLVAYFTVKVDADPAPNQQTLHESLSQALPNYMVPSVWVPLEQMPRTPNDKIDRKALPAPNLDELERTLPFTAPRTPTETRLHAIWQSLLEVTEISVHDSFFQLGGHSLLATQLASRIQKQFNMQFQLRDIFEQSSIAQIAKAIDGAQNGKAGTSEEEQITQRDGNKPAPLSFAQQRLLLLDQLEPNQATYNIPLAFKLDGCLNEAALQKTVDALYARHDSLRTSFYYGEDEQPYQRIAEATHLPINKVDFAELPQEEREEKARAWIYAEVERPFSLSTGPLIRVSQLRLGDEQHIMVIVMHHIISDGWSVSVLFREMAALYTAFVEEQPALSGPTELDKSKGPSPLPPLPIQYTDFAAWQRQWLQGDILQQQLDYWLDTLQGAPAVLSLPTDRPRPAVQSYQGALLNTEFPKEIMPALQALTQAENATLFMVLLAAFQTLLARYTHQDDIVVGSPIANRNRTEIEGLIGFFVNMLVLRTDTSGNPTFRDLLSRVRDTTLGAYAHQDIPFEKLVEEKHLARDMSYAPLFQVAFVLQNTPNQRVSLPELTLSTLDAPRTTAKYDLTLAITETVNGFRVDWEYSTALFDESTIARLAANFNQLLAQVAANPDRPIQQLEILTATEKALMQQWNKTERPFPSHLCLHQLIDQHANQTPDRIAISDGQTALTYRELETKSNQLAHYLLSLGVQPDTFVAVALERNAHLLVALLGILKAGGAYLPIDPAFPAQRIQFMLADAQAPLLLTQTSLANSLPEHQAQRLCLDELLPNIDDLPTELPETAVAPHNLAYIIYTSGSTGRPKGVQITHNSLVNLLTSMADQPGIDPDDKLLAITTLSFDIATVELYLPLLAGAQIVIAPQTAVTDPQQLIDLLQRENITYLQATPATWQMLLNADWQGQPGLKMITGGEALSVALAQQLLQRGEKLWNMYAPSETTTYSTIHPVLAAELDPQQSIPIGRPLANTQLYILDDNLQQVPIGVTGELYIGGVGVARGYLNQPELTDERFIPLSVIGNPYSVNRSPITDHRLPNTVYRTGDLASFRPDGAVNFLGRSDHQVKVRGFRVELGEIESRLRQHPDVAQVVVHPFEQQLVAYLIYAEEKASDDAATTAELRAFLQETLPAYMIPHIFMPVEAFPLTPNGKVDRKALPTPTGERETTAVYIPPRNQIEAQLVDIWQTLLKVDRVSIYDNFFELGGHSLLATQLVSRIQKQFNLKLPLRELFEQSTVAQIAGLIEQSPEHKPDKAIHKQFIPQLPDGRQPPLSFAQRRLLVMDELAPNKATFNIPLAFKIDGRLDNTALQTAVNTLYQRHSSLRTTFHYGEDGQPYQHIANDTHLPIEQVDFSTLPEEVQEEKVEDWIREEAGRPFNLSTGPLVRLAHLCLSETEHILVVVMHHIITDGWSMGIFVREFVSLYVSQAKGFPLDLPELRVQYADFAAWQQTWLPGDVLEEQLAFWQNHLAGAPAVLSLPTNMPRPKMQSTRGDLYSQLLPKELTSALTRFGQSHKSTRFMTLMAAYNILLMRYSQQNDIVVGTPIANRNHPEIENIIGFFVNMLPLRTQISEDETFSTLLDKMRQTALDAYNHQDIPFEQVVNLLQPERDTSHSPIFQVSFALQNNDTSLPQLNLNDLSLTPLTADSKTAKYDLTLMVTETNNGLLCHWEYSTDLFWPETIKRMHKHFETLLHSIVQQPDLAVTKLSILPPTEKQLLLHDWQGKVDPTIPQISLSQQIEEWAKRQPGVTAVSDQHTSLTYAQLNQRANQLARLLINQGVQPGNAVGIHMSASVPAILGIVACHKARAACVPFDPAYPDQRLQFMLDDTATPVILTDSNLDHLDTGNCAVWQWNAIQSQLDQQDATNLNLAYAPTDRAYIIYTSGSTGTPKGVICGHTGVFNLLRSFDQWGELPPQANSSLWTSLNFDVAVYEIFAALISGGALHIVPADLRMDAAALFTWLAKKQIASVYLPPFMVEPFAAWLKEGKTYPAMRRLLVGVEPLAEQTLVAIQKRQPQAAVINAYGPTEATVCVTAYSIPADSRRQGNAPLGKALLNTELYVLDEEMQPAPIGVAGELYIGGMGLAHGYLNRPDLTAENFVPNPFSDDPEARLYRTGDLVHYLPDGNLMFNGRTDFQLKVRGFRIELGEIESKLLAQPGVAAGVVMPHTAADGQITLVAYYELEQDAAASQQTLRDGLHNDLPNYMVPAVWIQLEQMPRTPNDKIDRNALPAPNLEAISREAAYAPPSTPLEKRLVALWENLLQMEEIGIHDNFFSLGGHSLLAVQLMTALRQQMGKELPLRLLFDAPTIAELAHELEKVSDLANLEPIPKRTDDGPLPLSFAQRRLWFISEMNPQANVSYNVPIHLEIEGPLDLEALEYSFNQLLQRHESLRTRYPLSNDEMPAQEVLAYTAVTLPITDLANLPAAEKETQARQLRQQSAQTPFDLQNGPIYRIHILRLDKMRHQLLFTIHHIAFDAWSTNLFLREVVAHYLHQTTGLLPPLPDSDVQYADFTLWQQARLTPEVLDKQLAFWREHLAHAPTSLALPTDKPRPQTPTANGDLHEFTLPPEMAKQVKQWTQTNGATLFMSLLTAFYGLLYRYSNQDDIVIGTPIANRDHPDLKNIIGFFLNTVALRAQLEETMTWQDLLQQVRSTMIAAQAHQEFPFENLVQALLPDRDPSRHPLFQVMFVLQNQGDAGQLPGNLPIQINQLGEGTQTAKFDLLLELQETAAGFTASFEYNTDLFNPGTIQRMAEHFQQMVAAMVSAPDQPIAQANLLTPQEQRQIEAWNDTAVPIDPHQLIHHRFETQADKTPTAVAAEFGNDQLTYAELEAQANQLAHFLQVQGVQPGDRVGLLLPRSLPMVTAVLATLKAGAGYVPLDPNYPTDRLQVMMQQADVKLLLSHSTLPQDDIGTERHNVDELDLTGYSVERVTAVIDPEHPVYIIFTSGSTGQPKGVTLPHRALNNVLAWQQRATHRQRPARTLQFTSLSFDVHFQEMFTTWQDGGTLVLIADDVRRDGERLLAYLQKHKIERLFLPFVALQNLAEAAQWQQSYPHTLQEVITAGEALLSTPAIREFFSQLPHCAFHNHYGPSESHVVTQHTLGPDPQQWPDLPPIGTPIDNTQIYLLDSNMKPVPIGVPGELYIGGRNLALGYFNQPELTAERFIPLSVNGNPSSVNRSPNTDHRPPYAKRSRSDITVYRTGDLARYLPDGNIQYLGRNDFQVKIRGHRVELGEIETVLNEQPTVQQAVVQAYKPDEGPQQLIAYIKTSEDDVINELHMALRERLPAHMVPAHFMQLEQFPLTPSGKINRRDLPIPDKVEVVRSTPFVAAETELQKQLVQIWEEVVGVSPIGIHDNFFELGGHSLLALRLVAAMHKATAVKIPLPRLFQESTIAALAEFISDPTAESPLTPLVPLRTGNPEQEPLVLIHPGSGQVLPYLKLVNSLPGEQPVYGLQSAGLLPDTPAQTDIETMAATYLKALYEADIRRPYHLAGWSMGGVVAMAMAQQLEAAGNPAASLTLIDTFAPGSSAAETNETTLLQWFAQDTGYLTPSVRPTLLPDEASLDAQLRHLWPQLQATGNLPAGLTFQDLQHQFAVFQANYAAMQTYQPQKYRLPVNLITAKASAKSVRNKWLGWKKYLRKRSVEVLPGTHFSLLQDPKTIQRIAELLIELLPTKASIRG
ncbi:MAG: hypothetical protein CL608_10525 [Anaerolineaceae bacterium]|nr:hypothetical protein [Anaerolineaceae bacterium]